MKNLFEIILASGPLMSTMIVVSWLMAKYHR